MEKKCSKCSVSKPLNEFHKNKRKPDGLRCECKQCAIEYRRNYYENNRADILRKKKEYAIRNKDMLRLKSRKYWVDNRETLCENKRNHYKENRSRLLEEKKDYYKKNKEAIKQKEREYRLKNSDKIKSRLRANRDRINKYYRKKYSNDPIFKIRRTIGSVMAKAFKGKGYKKNSKTKELLGCEFKTAKKHIERQFTKGMTWSNHGEWHIDHIIPLSSAKTEAELYKLCHYRNLQPLWGKDNRIKSASIADPVQTYLPL